MLSEDPTSNAFLPLGMSSEDPTSNVLLRSGMLSEGPTVTALNIHPIKSCRACAVEEITLDQYGVVDDRRLMVVDSSGRFVSQRKFPILATVTARYYNKEGGGRILKVEAPSLDTHLELEPVFEGQTVQCSIWEDTIQLVDQGQAAADWFSRLIGRSGFYRLVGCGRENYTRAVTNLPVSLKNRLPPLSIGLADAGPVSLISQSSLDDLNKRMSSLYECQVPLNRFRMNIELGEVSEAFEEDSWLLIRIGEVPFLAYVNAEVRV